MKLAVKITFILGAFCFLMLNSGCSKKHPAPPSITDQQIALLTKATWKVTDAKLDGVSQMADYGTFTFTFTKTDATHLHVKTAGRTGTKYPWAADTNNLTFDAANPATTLNRDDGVVITYSATADLLQMSFDYNGPGFNARTSIVTGQWTYSCSH